MQSLEDALAHLVLNGTVKRELAMLKTSNPKRLQAMLDEPQYSERLSGAKSPPTGKKSSSRERRMPTGRAGAARRRPAHNVYPGGAGSYFFQVLMGSYWARHLISKALPFHVWPISSLAAASSGHFWKSSRAA